MTPAAMLLYILVGVGLARLWDHRYEAFDALVGAVDRLCTDPPPDGGLGGGVAPARSCVRVLRPGGDGDDDGWGGEAA